MASRSMSACARLLMSSLVHAKWVNSSTCFQRIAHLRALTAVALRLMDTRDSQKMECNMLVCR